jgi:hypothetical protein
MYLSDVIGISVRHGEHVYLAPSGVQKERIKPEHIFVLPFAQSSVPKPGSQRDFLRIPTQAVGINSQRSWTFANAQGLKESACTPLFWNAFTMRNAGACIHTHSQHAGESKDIHHLDIKLMISDAHSPFTSGRQELPNFPPGDDQGSQDRR